MTEYEFQSKLKMINIAMWIPHVISMICMWRYADWWVAVLFLIGYVFIEKYIGYLLDIASLVVAIVICSITYFNGTDIVLIILSALGLILPWVLKSYFFKMLQKFSED